MDFTSSSMDSQHFDASTGAWPAESITHPSEVTKPPEERDGEER